ncbi:MAG: flagellar protein FlaG [Lachnospiraceae bacterium]|jgi:flagellar protein FlaG|nr:flagellar protein FlaG [Lachnospiraceae bacterium]
MTVINTSNPIANNSYSLSSDAGVRLSNTVSATTGDVTETTHEKAVPVNTGLHRVQTNEEGKNNVDVKRSASQEQIKEAVDTINKSMPNTEAIFGIHEKTNRVMIKIIDKDTHKVIKEFPPEKTLDLIAKAWELAGILVDEKR